MNEHEPTRKRRRPSSTGAADERRGFFGRRAFELARDASCIVDFAGVVKDVNPALERDLGHARTDLVGRKLADLVHPDDWPRTAEELGRLASGSARTARFENRLLNADRRWHWLDWTAHAAPVEGLVYASARDIGARKRREHELERAAHVDPLTGIANRRGFEQALERELAAAERHSLRPALIVLDLDRFKPINDRHGHRTGDELLEAAGGALRENLRAGDLAARIGGDEFAVLLPHSDRATADLVAQKILAALADRSVEAAGVRLNVSASAGVALFGERGVATGSELMAAADEAMYRAKRRRSSPGVRDPRLV